MDRPLELIKEPMQRTPPQRVESNITVVTFTIYGDGAFGYMVCRVELDGIVLYGLVFLEWVAL